MSKKIVLITLLVTFASFTLSGILAKNYGHENMVQYLEDVANQSFNHKNNKTALTEETLDAEKTNEIEVNTTDVNIKFEKSEDNKIKIIYYKGADDQVSDLIHINGLTMKLDLDKISSRGASVQFNFTEREKNLGLLIDQKSVRILIPENIKKIKIKSVSAEVEVLSLILDSFIVESVSGDTHIESSTIEHVEAYSASGDLDVRGTAKEVIAESISGDFKLKSDIDNPNVKFNTTSGDTRAVFATEPNVNFKFDSVSGELSFSKELTRTEITGEIKDLKFGKGEGTFEVNSTSGDVEIVKSTE